MINFLYYSINNIVPEEVPRDAWMLECADLWVIPGKQLVRLDEGQRQALDLWLRRGGKLLTDTSANAEDWEAFPFFAGLNARMEDAPSETKLPISARAVNPNLTPEQQQVALQNMGQVYDSEKPTDSKVTIEIPVDSIDTNSAQRASAA